MKRLSVPREDENGPRALAGVPAPVRGAGRACSLAQTLEICLDYAGLPLGYDAVMGFSGLAFRTPDPRTPTLATAEVDTAVQALGTALDPGPRLHAPDECLSPDAVLELVAQAVRSGLPCAALGWGSVKESWSVIAGYDRGRERLLGHCLVDAPREQYESWPPALDMLIVLPAPPRPAGSDATDGAIRRAAAVWDAGGPERWEAWGQPVLEPQEMPVADHLAAVELVTDARAAAAAFLLAAAEHKPPVPAAWLLRAAERYRRVVELLEVGGASWALVGPEAAHLALGERLSAILALEAAAARDLRFSLIADFSPEESDDA